MTGRLGWEMPYIEVVAKMWPLFMYCWSLFFKKKEQQCKPTATLFAYEGDLWLSVNKALYGIMLTKSGQQYYLWSKGSII